MTKTITFAEALERAQEIIDEHKATTPETLEAGWLGYRDCVLRSAEKSKLTEEEKLKITFYAGIQFLWRTVEGFCELPQEDYERRMALIDHELTAFRQSMYILAGMPEKFVREGDETLQ